jgi:hypothetical protein
MSVRSLTLFVAAAAFVCVDANFAFAETPPGSIYTATDPNFAFTGPAPDSVYTTTVQLPDGKNLSCAVNQPLPEGVPAAVLSTTEQRQADVLATQPLRLLSGPTSGYPTSYTAPHVVCAAA